MATPIKVANLESYLFEKVGRHFRETGEISTEDFWLIILWKSNRSKNNTRRALENYNASFDDAVKALASALFNKGSHKERLKELVIERGLGLAISSAILTVFYPDIFTIYDIRVCNQLGNFYKLKNCRSKGKFWDEYLKFVAAVKANTPGVQTLRDKDKTLWGLSLLADIKKELGSPAPPRKKAK